VYFLCCSLSYQLQCCGCALLCCSCAVVLVQLVSQWLSVRTVSGTTAIMVSLQNVKEQATYLVLWENAVHSSIGLCSVLSVLVSICYFSLIAVLAYISLAVLTLVFGAKVYNYGMVFMKKAEPGDDPLAHVYNFDVNIPPEKVAEVTGFLVDIINPCVMELRRLFLLENIIDTVKFVLCLWGLTYIGSWFNMMTLLILTWVATFTLPLVYKNNQAAVDEVVTTVNSQMADIKEKLMAVIPLKDKAARMMKKEE